MCREAPRWKWLAAYESAVTAYDELFRTPEVHKPSTLRARLMRGKDPTKILNDLGTLVNLAMNGVWTNVESIVGGGGVRVLGGVDLMQTADTTDLFDEWGWQPGDAQRPPGSVRRSR
jgi:hypothetical protein